MWCRYRSCDCLLSQKLVKDHIKELPGLDHIKVVTKEELAERDAIAASAKKKAFKAAKPKTGKPQDEGVDVWTEILCLCVSGKHAILGCKREEEEFRDVFTEIQRVASMFKMTSTLVNPFIQVMASKNLMYFATKTIWDLGKPWLLSSGKECWGLVRLPFEAVLNTANAECAQWLSRASDESKL